MPRRNPNPSVKKIRQSKSTGEQLRLRAEAIEMQKGKIAHYNGLLETVKDPAVKRSYEAIIKETKSLLEKNEAVMSAAAIKPIPKGTEEIHNKAKDGKDGHE